MRAAAFLAVLAALSVAGHGFAQSPGLRGYVNTQSQLDLLRAQQDLAARQQVLQQIEQSRLDAQLRTEQNFATLRAQTNPPQLPPPAGGDAQIDVSGLASIPDAALAASNARVRAAAENRP
jgi:hypothetical protein